MSLLAQFDSEVNKGEASIASLVLVFLLGCGFWAFIRWVHRAPSQPDPWGEEVSREIEKEEAHALCHRCLEPHESHEHFCPHCGAPVGECTNLMPFIYLFSIGHTLRIGTSGEYRKSSLTVIGFVLLSIIEYSVFAPFYLFRLFQNLPDKRSLTGSDIETPGG